jgi:hypothetical protein
MVRSPPAVELSTRLPSQFRVTIQQLPDRARADCTPSREEHPAVSFPYHPMRTNPFVQGASRPIKDENNFAFPYPKTAVYRADCRSKKRQRFRLGCACNRSDNIDL